MKFDPADLKVLASQISAIFGGKATPTAGGVAMNMGGPAGAAGSGSSNPSFMSIFKPLAFLELINKTLSLIMKNSSVANTYLGAMGKMFGAAMDLLLIPFLPLFNLLLVGLGKLVEWLARDDVQKFLSKIADFILNLVNEFLKSAGKVYDAINDHVIPVLDKMLVAIQNVLDWVKDHSPHIPYGDKIIDTAKDAGIFLAGVNILAGLAKGSHIPLVSQAGGAFFKAEGALAKGASTAVTKGGGGLFDVLGGVGGKLLGGATALYGADWLTNLIGSKVGGGKYGFNEYPWQGPPLSRGSWGDLVNRFGLGAKGAEASGSMIRPPNTGDGGLAGVTIQSQTITINVNGVYDSKKVAESVRDEFNKTFRSLTQR